MKVEVRRTDANERRTRGEMYLDGVFYCYTLEDSILNPVKVAGRTAIPAGTYELRVTWSPRFKRQLPLVLDVPGFEGIRIHAGNTPEDTEGCILVGKTLVGPDAIGLSRAALDPLVPRLAAAGANTIIITNPETAPCGTC